MPEGIAGNLTPEGLADLVAYLQSLDPNREIRRIDDGTPSINTRTGDLHSVSPEASNHMRFVESISDAILNCSPEELIGALIIAATVALVVAGFYALRRRKSSPSPTFVGSLGLAAAASCMALSAGYIEYAETNRTSGSGWRDPAAPKSPPGVPRQIKPPSPRSSFGPGWSAGFHVVVAADENRDGRLTPEEVVRLVKEADTDGDGSVNFRDIDRLVGAPLPVSFSTARPHRRRTARSRRRHQTF